jgi:cytoskeletal protein RodZ
MDLNHVETTGKDGTVTLGSFLRDEREKMNLSQDEIAQKIRLRRFIVEAIESDAWERLPPPVFVKGFVRSYARTLDLDEKRVLDLYHQSAPPEPEILKPVAVPRASHRVGILLLLLVLAAAGCIVYFWYVKASTGDRENLSMVQRAGPVQTETSLPDKPAKPMMSVPAVTVPDIAWPAPSEQTARAQVTAEADESATAPQRELPSMTLKASVKERTWMSIRVDDNEAKEFIFQPGARPQWKGTKGFEIVIGNAAGVDFELGGKKIDKLGQPGQVVRLNLPEGFKPGIREE